MPRKQDGGIKFLKLYRRSNYFWQTLKAMNLECGIIWGNGTLSDLDFADDIALIGKNRKSIQDMTSNLHQYAEPFKQIFTGGGANDEKGSNIR